MKTVIFALRRLLLSIPLLFIIMTALFILVKLAPGDTVSALVAQMGGADPQMIQQMREFYGLDEPLLVQLGKYLGHLARFELGYSAIYSKPVLTVLLERLPVTLLLMSCALSFAFAAGMALGVIAARRVNQWPDTLISTLGVVLYATPSFWIGLLMIIVFSVELSWLPTGGFSTIGLGLTGWERFVDVARHLLLPIVALSLFYLAIDLRIMRAAMLEVLTMDFVRTARAKGLGEYSVVMKHVLRNALLPMVTMMGFQVGTMLGGSVVVETVFSLPGLASLAYESVIQRDLNMLLGIIFLSAIVVIVVNFIVDIAYAKIDPRVGMES